MSYRSQQGKRARRRAQKKKQGRRQELAASRRGYYATKAHHAEVLALRRLKDQEGLAPKARNNTVTPQSSQPLRSDPVADLDQAA